MDSIENKGNNTEIVETIIALARSLGMKVIAEGVENETQLETLRHLNCEGAQGYYFAEPMPFRDVERFILDQSDLIPPGLDDLPLLPSVQ